VESKPKKKQAGHHGRVWSVGLDRSFSREELKRFFDVIDDERHHICYLMMATLGFRISEAIRVNLKDLDLSPERRRIRMWNAKTKTWINRKIPVKVYTFIRDYVDKHRPEIDAHQGYLIYSNTGKYLCDVNMRQNFRRYIEKAGLDDTYMEVDAEGKQPGKRRKLYRLSTHSLRRSFITRVYEETNSPIIAQYAGRHSKFASTECYLDAISKQVEDGMEKAFRDM
jgi:integrase